MSERPSVLICIPCYGGLCHVETMKSLIDILMSLNQHGIQTGLSFQYGESLISRGRNNFAHEFMTRTDYTHLLFIDADLKIPAEGILACVLSGYDLCGCVYPKKTINWDYVRDAMCREMMSGERVDLASLAGELVINKLDASEDIVEGFTEVAYLGTGAMLIKRRVFEEMSKHYGASIMYRDDVLRDEIVSDYFFVGIMDEPGFGRRYLSEDFAFVRRWRDMGGKVYAYTQAELTHYGTFGYKGIFREALVDEETGNRYMLLPVVEEDGTVAMKPVPEPTEPLSIGTTKAGVVPNPEVEKRRQERNKRKAMRKR